MQLLSIICEECIEAQVLTGLEYVRTIPSSQIGAENLDFPSTISALRRLREIYPKDAPDGVFCFSHSPFLAYRLHYLCFLAFGNALPISYFEVRPGSVFPGLGKVVSTLNLSGFTEALSKDFRFFGRSHETRSENQFVIAYLLFKAAAGVPIFKALVEEFMEKVLDLREGKGRARGVWRFCVRNDLANERPAVIVNKNEKIVHVLVLIPTELGVAWTLAKSFIQTDRIDKEKADEVFQNLFNRGSFVEEDPVLALCPIAKANKYVFSLYTMNFIQSKKALVSDTPGPCAFIDVRVPPKQTKAIVQEYLFDSEKPEKRVGNMFFKIVNARSRAGKLYIFCSSPNDALSPYREPPETILEKLEHEEFYYDGHCPYRYRDICMVQSPSNILVPLRKAMPKELQRLKFGIQSRLKRGT